MEEQPPAGGMNLLDLDGRPQRRQGFYWASVIVSIVVHSGFLVYLLTYARLPGEQGARPRSPDINVEVIGPTRSAALPRGDREDVIIEAPSEDARPQERPDEEAVEPDAAHVNAEELADQIGTPLPEDGARAGKPLPLPDRLPERRIGTNPVLAGRAPPIATPRTEARMSLPARRMSQMAAEARLSERPVPDPQPGDRRPPPNAIPLPPAKVPAAPEHAHLAPGSEESHASTLDMGTQGDPVVAVLPKEAGVAMFGARIIDGAPMLPEDRPAPPAPMPLGQSPPPAQSAESRPVPPPGRRAARPPVPRDAKAEHSDPESAEDKSASSAGAKKARAYQGNVRAHLAANRPAGAYGSGRAVVAFNLSPVGAVRSARIVQSSGNATLDQSVLQSVQRAAPFPKPPTGLKPAQLRFVIPFEFR
jgi:periplasmic protein TonB